MRCDAADLSSLALPAALGTFADLPPFASMSIFFAKHVFIDKSEIARSKWGMFWGLKVSVAGLKG